MLKFHKILLYLVTLQSRKMPSNAVKCRKNGIIGILLSNTGSTMINLIKFSICGNERHFLKRLKASHHHSAPFHAVKKCRKNDKWLFLLTFGCYFIILCGISSKMPGKGWQLLRYIKMKSSTQSVIITSNLHVVKNRKTLK